MSYRVIILRRCVPAIALLLLFLAGCKASWFTHPLGGKVTGGEYQVQALTNIDAEIAAVNDTNFYHWSKPPMELPELLRQEPSAAFVSLPPPVITTTAIYSFVLPNPEWTGFVPVQRSEVYAGPDPAHQELGLALTNLLQTLRISNRWRGYAITNSVTNVTSAHGFYFSRRDFDWNGQLILYTNNPAKL